MTSDEPRVLVAHHGLLTRDSLRVALEVAALDGVEPTHIAIPAQDEPLTDVVKMLGEIPTGKLGAGLTLLCCAGARLRGRKGFALLVVPPGCRLYRAMMAAENAIVSVL